MTVFGRSFVVPFIIGNDPSPFKVTVFVVTVLLAIVFLAPIGDAEVFVTLVVVVLFIGDFLAARVDPGERVVEVAADDGDKRLVATPDNVPVDDVDFVVAVRVVVDILVSGLYKNCTNDKSFRLKSLIFLYTLLEIEDLP